jgi:hypothetical protein
VKNILAKFSIGSIFAIPDAAPDVVHAAAGTPAGFKTVRPTTIHLGHSKGSFSTKDRISSLKAGASGDGHRNFVWLPYIPGYVSEVEQTNLPIITGPLSGCPTTRYSRGGKTYVGHPGTEDHHDSANSQAARAYWNSFALSTYVRGVNVLRDLQRLNFPGMATPHAGDGAIKFWAIVMPNGDFYGMAAFSQANHSAWKRPTPVPAGGLGGTAWWRVAIPPTLLSTALSAFSATGLMA